MGGEIWKMLREVLREVKKLEVDYIDSGHVSIIVTLVGQENKNNKDKTELKVKRSRKSGCSIKG